MPKFKEHILDQNPKRIPSSDITGTKINRWTVISFAGRDKWIPYWNCRCDCGTEMIVQHGNLIRNKTKSCGCHRTEERAKRITHGFSRRKEIRTEYRIWANIIQRCTNPKNPKFHDYGGRGIMVCDRWHYGENGLGGFECFYQDMGPRPLDLKTCGRINNNGGYFPENCRWETNPQQAGNKRNNVLLTYKGETLPRHEMAKKYGIKYFTLRSRLKYGMTIEQAIEMPINFRHIIQNSHAPAQTPA